MCPEARSYKRLRQLFFNQVGAYYFETMIAAKDAASADGFLKMKTFSHDQKEKKITSLSKLRVTLTKYVLCLYALPKCRNS